MTPFRRLLSPLLLILLLAAVTLIVVTATGTAAVTIEWSTASELNTAGFNLYRGETQNGPFTRINADLIPASPDPLIGGSYIFTDTAVVAGRTYFYQLEDVDNSGAATVQGVVEVKAEGGLDPVVLIALAAGGLAVAGVMTFVTRKRRQAISLSHDTGQPMSASARIDSPHLAHPQQAADFKLEVVDESADNGRAALLQQAGAFADDEALPQLLAEIYAERGRPEVPDTDEEQS